MFLFERQKDFSMSWAVSGFDLGNFESVLEAVGVLTTIVVVHEGGHFLAAYLQGIHVSKFAVGFGPILAKFNAMNVEYSIRAFPLGGFVGFPDNDPESDIPVDDENLLKNRPILDRTIVISAGVIANIIFAYVIIFAQVLSVGLPVQEAFPGVLIPEVRAFSAASRDGLLPGDVIIAVNGTKLPKTGPQCSIRDESFDGAGKIGVQLAINVKITRVIAKNIFEAFNFAGEEFWGLSSKVKLQGPNIDGLYQFAAVLNINLAVINLLPLPALDGGSLALILIEAARGGRKLPLEIEQRIMSSGIMLVSILGLFLIVRDTLNLDFIKDMM
ncbi:hypothetical protein OIU78_011168 [Salix suchowensis]|nr:hypothetical protein OIU78_011168 [Salix suchowensis]